MTEYKSPVPVDITDPRSMQFGTTQNLRRIAQSQRHISRNQRGDAASALDWAADRIDELETDCRIWEQNALGALVKLEDERSKNRNLMKVIFAIVLKHGGETRLSIFDRSALSDDFELIQYEDKKTLELVIKALEPRRQK